MSGWRGTAATLPLEPTYKLCFVPSRYKVQLFCVKCLMSRFLFMRGPISDKRNARLRRYEGLALCYNPEQVGWHPSCFPSTRQGFCLVRWLQEVVGIGRSTNLLLHLCESELCIPYWFVFHLQKYSFSSNSHHKLAISRFFSFLCNLKTTKTESI